jgi:hypothetical protein
MVFVMVLMVVMGGVGYVWISGAGQDLREEQQVKTLEEVEISEYKGEKLSSIDDFRENSIKGPQYVN